MSFIHLVKTYEVQNDKFLLPKKQLVTYALYALIAVALLYLFIDPAPASSSKLAVTLPWVQQELPPPSPPAYQQAGDEVLNSAPTQQGKEASASPTCDYSDGEWVPDPTPPLYNGTTCEAIKDGRSCAANGRADTGYLHWRWQPRRCDLPAFSPSAFLRWLRNKHLAFVGDSLARNQAESLVCLLSSSLSRPQEEEELVRFRRWVFIEHNATVSVSWSPFLVRGVEKAGVPYNDVVLDAFDERWMSRLGEVDAVVLSAGQWFKIPSVYHESGGRVVGCHACAKELNHTETSFFAAFRDAVHRTLAEITRRHEHDAAMDNKGRKEKVVAMATFSPSHFEGDWDKGAPCPKKQPYKSGEKELGYTEAEMRRIVLEEVEAASAGAEASGVRFAALDVTTLANLRPDGHPGPYMRKNPVVGPDGRVQNDCLHWCMPGPVDTFNQILQQTVLR
ncbi:hypothetical protein PR202_gb22968 [Eleusine coracana subsp. coracana]|uniref:Trichome birefringence-like N-terminal domain-containing protein n=1 Tax=Eleusine coracana subsp. coracana TaxID=191504 RepID=A0AAV5FF30_ELECO|nr:hypothetical protein QOZ80_6BG0484270 [Eleusine coracana subsp. coracana]GJN34318.1 hypothetical protein PR202_gb22968 [Eleusine coracana subsp. coracana]